MKYLVLDTETTGLIPWKHRLLTIGGVILNDDFEEINHFHIPFRAPLWTPGYKEAEKFHKLPKAAMRKVHHNRRLSLAVLSLVNALYNRPTVVGHNIAFDYYFIEAEYMRHGIENPLSHRMIDLPGLARIFNLPIKLVKLQEALGVVNPKPHDALADARATADCFRILMKELRQMTHLYPRIYPWMVTEPVSQD